MLELAWWIWILLLYCVGIAFALDALWQGRTAQGTLAWVVGLSLAPFITIPLYSFFGARRFRGYLHARRSDHQALNRIAQASNEAVQAVRLPTCDVTAPFYSLFRTPQTSGNQCELLTSGADFYKSMFNDIANARQYVCVQFYILRADHAGNALADALCQKAQQGIPTYLIYDEIGSSGLNKAYLSRLTKAGVHVSPFNSSRLRTRFQLNFRNHRKLVICDGHICYVGGYNLGDEYLGDGSTSMFWRDTHIRIAGPSTLGFQLTFLEDWHWATQSFPALTWEALKPCGNANIMAIASGPADDTESASLFFSHLVHHAKKRCWIATPYFIPDQNLFSALQLAGLRGIDVVILVPGENDNVLVKYAMRNYIANLRKCNVKFLTYKKGFLHQKVLLIDDEWASIGSANLDNRSLRINFEINALIQSNDFALNVEAMLLNDFKDSEPTDIPTHWWPTLLTKTTRLLSPLL